MNITRLVAVVALAVGLWIPAAQAQVAGTAPSPAAQNLSSAAHIKGSIGSVDLKAQPPIVKVTSEQGKLVTLQVDPSATKVTQNGQAAKLEALKVGQQVEVESSEKNGKPVARAIAVTAGSAASSAMPAQPAEPAAAVPAAPIAPAAQ